MIQSGAVFSSCRIYRYVLWRCWNPNKPSLLFIGLNPSKADEQSNDPTVRRCIQFAKDLQFGGVRVANLFAYCATLPKDLFQASDPVGVKNDLWLHSLISETEHCVAAWGNLGVWGDRAAKVCTDHPNLHCLSVNKSGQPGHPLYLPRTSILRPYSSPKAACSSIA